MDCVELISRSKVVQKNRGIDRIRKMDRFERLKVAVEMAEELGRKGAKRKCAMRLVEMTILAGKFRKAKKIAEKTLEEIDFLKAVSNANQMMENEGKYLRAAEINRRYSFVHGMALSAGLEIKKRIKVIEYSSLKGIARKYRAERELARCIKEEIQRLRSRKLNGDADWLARKFAVEA